MKTRKAHSGIGWALPAFIILFALWTLGALYALNKAPSSADPTIQDKNKNAQEGEGVAINTMVELVITDVTVIGKQASELKHDDFIIYDNGVVHPVDFFSRDDLHIAVALLIDADRSTQSYMPAMPLAGISALRKLKPDDKAILYSFFMKAGSRIDLTDDLVKVTNAIKGIESHDGTALNDAIVDASDYLYKRTPNYRRAIILISDNQSTKSTMSSDQALNHLLESFTTLYSVVVRNINAASPNREAQESVLQIPKMVEDTGGELFNVKDPAELQDAVANAIVNMRKQYTLGFCPSKPGKAGTYHKLEIKFASSQRCPGCIIRSRKGYYNGTATSSVPAPSESISPIIIR
jgi:Ca-activated chloride channel homolog